MFERAILDSVKLVDKNFYVLLMTGPRQVGKSTIMIKLCEETNRTYVSLDHPPTRKLAQEEPGIFIQKYPPPVCIDEIQYAPELFSYIKLHVDREKKCGAYWLTGSQKFRLMKGVSESLAGRVGIIDLLGLSQSEIEDKKNKSIPFLPTLSCIKELKINTLKQKTILDVYKQIWIGSFPRINDDEQFSIESREKFYSSYLQTYLERDVRDLSSIENLNSFLSFMSAVAARTSQILNINDIANTCDITVKTANAWLLILEASGIIYLLYPYSRNTTKRLVKKPKLYFLDTGLCSYITKWSTAESLEVGAMSGAILETYIFSEILKSYYNSGIEPYFYYYRDFDQKEIDLLIERDNTLFPIEFKKTANPSKKSFSNFSVLDNLDKEVGHGAVICFIEEDLPLSKDVTAVPLWYL